MTKLLISNGELVNSETNSIKESIELVKIKRQERREALYAKTCTGVIFGHKKGTYEWYKQFAQTLRSCISKLAHIPIIATKKTFSST